MELYEASENGDIQQVRSLLHIHSPNQQHYQGQTPLWIASSMGHVEIVRLLLAHGAVPMPLANRLLALHL